MRQHHAGGGLFLSLSFHFRFSDWLGDERPPQPLSLSLSLGCIPFAGRSLALSRSMPVMARSINYAWWRHFWGPVLHVHQQQ